MRRIFLLSGLVLAGLACFGPSLRAEPKADRTSAARVVVTDAEPPKDAKDAAPSPHAKFFCSNRPTCWAVYGEFLVLSARNESVPYAQIRDGEGPLAVPRGATGNIDTEYSYGVRGGAQAVLTPNILLNIGFSWYDTRNTDHIEVGANDPFIVHSLTTHPNTINAAADSLSADANLNIRFYTGEFDLRYGLCGSDCSHLALILGGRFAHLDQDFLGRYTLLGATDVSTRINFDGGGPRIGLEGHYNVFGRTFVYGRSDVSLLFGHFGANYLQTNVFAGVQAETSFSDDRFVPILETELGVGWKSKNGRVELAAGYTAMAWFNAMTTSNWIQGVQDASFSNNRDNLRDTLSFDGFFARFLFRF